MSDDKEYVNEVVWDDYKAGDSITGILVDHLSNIGEYKNNLYKIKSDDDKFYSVWGCSKLDEQMEKLKVTVGMKIEITFNGLVRTSNGYDMKDFSVIIID